MASVFDGRVVEEGPYKGVRVGELTDEPCKTCGGQTRCSSGSIHKPSGRLKGTLICVEFGEKCRWRHLPPGTPVESRWCGYHKTNLVVADTLSKKVRLVCEECEEGYGRDAFSLLLEGSY